MKIIKKLLTIFAVMVLGGAFALAPAGVAQALDPLESMCGTLANPDPNTKDTEICKNRSETGSSLIKDVINTLLFVVGALSVVMIIVSGILYVTSTGDSGRVSKAKNTLTYSVVGLIVAFLAYAIINWVVKEFS